MLPNLVKSKETLNKVLKYIMISCFLVTIFGVYQFLGDMVGLSNEITGLRQHYTQEVFGFHSRRGPFRNDPLRAITEFWWMNELFLYVAVLAAGFARGYFLMYQARREEAVTLMAEKTHLQAQLAETRLMSLRMQLNPHFLFNTLNAVSSLVDRDPRGVRRMIARLSELLRHTLDGDASQEISLQEELEFVDRYLDIEQIRFQGKLEIDKDVPCDVVEALVPNMILQPLVENAVKHGATRNEGVGRIDIAAWRDGDSLFLSVQDNGPGFNNETTSNGTGVGLKNTRARLEALYGDTASLNIKRADDGGVIATIRLPFHLPVNRPEAGS